MGKRNARKPVRVTTEAEYAETRAEAKILERRLHGLRPHEERRLFELQKVCYEWLSTLPEDEQERLWTRYG